MREPTTPEQARSIADSVLPRWQESNDALRSLAKQVEALKAERDALRAIIVESVDALGTAARVSQTSSIEFLQYVPGEIRNTVDALKADAVRVDWLEQQRQGYGFDGVHEGNRWVVDGPYRTVRIGIDAAMKAAS